MEYKIVGGSINDGDNKKLVSLISGILSIDNTWSVSQLTTNESFEVDEGERKVNVRIMCMSRDVMDTSTYLFSGIAEIKDKDNIIYLSGIGQLLLESKK